MADDKKNIGPEVERPDEAPQEKKVEPIKDTPSVPEQPAPGAPQVQQLRKLAKEGKLNPDVIDGILSQEKKKEDRNVIINGAELEKYFGKDKSPCEMKDQIIALLDAWKARQPTELAKHQKKTEKAL